MKTAQGTNATGAFSCLKRPWSRGCFHFNFSRYPLHSLINATGVQITCFSPKRRIMERRSLFWQTDHRALGLARGLGNQGKCPSGALSSTAACASRDRWLARVRAGPLGAKRDPSICAIPWAFSKATGDVDRSRPRPVIDSSRYEPKLCAGRIARGERLKPQRGWGFREQWTVGHGNSIAFQDKNCFEQKDDHN